VRRYRRAPRSDSPPQVIHRGSYSAYRAGE